MNCNCDTVLELTKEVSECMTRCKLDAVVEFDFIVYYVCFVAICSLLYCTFLCLISGKTTRDYDSMSCADEVDHDNHVNEPFELSDLVVFGMTGRKRSGKDTSGKRLIEEHGFVRIAFADALKEACINVFGFSRDQVYGDELKEVTDDYWGYTPREVLQRVGTELFREVIARDDVLPLIGNNIWVRTVMRKILNLAKKGYRRFVITDVRFPNELAFLKESGFNGYSIKVVRPSVMDNTTKLHASEALVDEFECDFNVKNDSTIEDLYTGIDQIVRMTEKNNAIDA